jgi:membrane-associated phospholipid phosphatase
MVVIGRNLDAVDRVTLFYNALVALLLVLFSSRIPNWHFEIFLNLAVMGVVLFIFSRITENAKPWPRLLKYIYPVFLFTPAYMQTGRTNRILFSNLLDPFFQKFEITLFGFQPAIDFANRFPQGWLCEWMHFAYFSYYLMVPGLALILYLTRSRGEQKEFMLALCATFYFCYLCYILLPIEGALSFGQNDFTQGGPFTHLMKSIYGNFESPGAAFPSSHVAVALVILYYTVKFVPKIAPLFILLGVSLVLATVYCRYHYAVDVLGGIFTMVLVTGLGQVFRLRVVIARPELERQ